MKVAIPYVIWSLIYVVMGYYSTPAQIPLLFIKKLLTGRATKATYYILVYCEFTMLIPLIDRLARSRYKLLGFAVAPLEIILMRLIPNISGYSVPQSVSTIMGISCLGWFSYYYLGYLLGNDLLEIKTPTPKLTAYLLISIGLQMLEGFAYYSAGISNAGTQLKLTSILSGTLFALLAFRWINADTLPGPAVLRLAGDLSFGVFFCHLAVMSALDRIPFYHSYAVYPLNAVITMIVSCICVLAGRKLLGEYSKYMAL